MAYYGKSVMSVKKKINRYHTELDKETLKQLTQRSDRQGFLRIISFTTLGFGDVTPLTETAMWLVMAEVILGYVMLGGLISIFANKIARRS